MESDDIRVYHTKSVYCFKKTFVSDVCVYRCVCVCARAHTPYACCISDPDNNVFLLCCALKSLKNISLSDEVWYHLQMRKLRHYKVKQINPSKT